MLQQLLGGGTFGVVSGEALMQKVDTLLTQLCVDFWEQIRFGNYVAGLDQVGIIEEEAPRIPSVEHFNDSAAERPHIALASCSSLFNNFRSHPLDAADDLAFERGEGRPCGRTSITTFFEFTRTAEVAQLDYSVIVGQHVGALQVQVLDLLLVQVG
jgi:hypothetical protein